MKKTSVLHYLNANYCNAKNNCNSIIHIGQHFKIIKLFLFILKINKSSTSKYIGEYVHFYVRMIFCHKKIEPIFFT